MKSRWQKVLFDVEVAPNFFCVTFMDFTSKEKKTFEVSTRLNEQKKLFNFYYNTFERCPYGYQKTFLIGFNSEHYDIPIINYLLFKKNCTLQELDDFSYTIVNEDFWWKTNPSLIKYKYPSKRYISIDLYLYWSRMLRLSKKISLKSLAVQLRYHTIQELPYEPNTPLPIDKFDEVIHYNRVHDLNITNLLCEKMKKDIRLRQNIKKKYNLNCMSWDATKIGINLLRKFYKDKTGKKLDISKEYNFIDIKDVILSEIEFDDKPLVSNKTNNYFTSNAEFLEELKTKIVRSTTELKNRVVLEQPNGMKLVSDFGSGGIHGVAFKGILEPKDDETLLDIDV